MNSPKVAHTLGVEPIRTYKTRHELLWGWKMGDDFRIVDVLHPNHGARVSARNHALFETNTTVIFNDPRGRLVVLGTYEGKKP